MVMHGHRKVGEALFQSIKSSPFTLPVKKPRLSGNKSFWRGHRAVDVSPRSSVVQRKDDRPKSRAAWVQVLPLL